MTFYKTIFTIIISLSVTIASIAQEEADCGKTDNKKATRLFEKSIDYYSAGQYNDAIKTLRDIIEMEPDYAEPYYLLGTISIKRADRNLKAAKMYFKQAIELCPDYDPYAYYYLGDIYYGAEKYDTASIYLKDFLKDVDKIKSDEDYKRAEQMQKYAEFYDKMYKNPVPFEPKPLEGISTPLDEYLPIITPDEDYCYFTRRTELPQQRTAWSASDKKYKEKFFDSERRNGVFNQGEEMPEPFNLNENEGGATLTIDNKLLIYTICKNVDGGNYYNCDICYSENRGDNQWSSIKNLGKNVNSAKTWESQPTISSDGKTLYFISDRPGGFGGYDIYKTNYQANGEWSVPKNMGPTVNTAGNEKSPFIHTDSQTLYFASDGWQGMGGYDIFYIRLGEEHKWKEPKNIGHPINSKFDDAGFFVSTDGRFAYFASNQIKGVGGWDIFYFDLYEEARPEKVLFIKGELKDEKTQEAIPARIELKNLKTKKITEIPVDTLTGKYVAVVPFKNDYLLTIKKDDYAYESKYISTEDETFKQPAKIDINIRQIEVGASYQLKDINFATNSFELNDASKFIIDGFIMFLKENPHVSIEIQGHTDDVGNDKTNLTLSDNRAKSVYEYLVQNNIYPSRLSYKGYGELKPIALNTNEEGRAKNRRTVFVIKSK
jgi:outer membrane protein OmpA-like peptidoglycan-associated protein/tetratricopeptide (TPR) repeat protein